MGISGRQVLGFSVIELLVVIGLIALLIAFLLPAVNTARQQVVAVKCLSRMRQMGLAFQMYANDNRGWMASSDTCGPLNPETFVDPSGSATTATWTGWVDGGSSSRSIQNGTLWPYLGTLGPYSNLKNIAVYHCPNDINPYRVRSYSMNAFIDPGSSASAVTNSFKIYKLNQVTNPSRTILFAEEPDPRSMLPGASATALIAQWNSNGWAQAPAMANATGLWGNLVASWHSGGANFTFVDGHAEYWKYRDQRTIDCLKNDPGWPTIPYKTPNNPDLNRISTSIVTWPLQRPTR